MNSQPFLLRHAAWWLIPLSVLLPLLLLEGVLRLRPQLLPEEAQLRLLWKDQTEVNSLPDPYLGFVYPAHRRLTVTSRDFSMMVQTDEHGFRNGSPWPASAEVVVVGDSMAFGWGVDNPEAWTTLLARELAIERLINLGLPGAAPQQYTRFLERFGLALRPKLVIFALFPGNDLVDAQRFADWLEAGSPGNYGTWRHSDGEVPSWHQELLDSSHVLLFLRSVRKDLHSAFATRTLDLPDGGRLQLAPTIYLAELERDEPSNPAFQHVLQAVNEARALTEQAGARFLVVLFPIKETVYLPLEGVAFPGLIPPLLKAIRAQNIPALDLTAPFREEAAAGKQLYFEIDGHPNTRGYRLAARVISKHIQADPEMCGLKAEEPR